MAVLSVGLERHSGFSQVSRARASASSLAPVPGRLYDATWGRMFARGYDWFFQVQERAGLTEMRRRALATATGRCLEIGAGTGLNLELWPDDVEELVLTEPDPHMAQQLRRKRGDRPARVVETGGEELPFDDDSFDTVALTLVLCTIPDPEAALREIGRVLRPGGSFLFLEHVRSPEAGLARWQDRLHRPWYLFGNGCNCNRDPLAYIEHSPLELERAERGEIPKAVPIVRPALTGVARPRASR
jgi:ubiquinone/menaquinone biosynthesis C-methylase UbiE